MLVVVTVLDSNDHSPTFLANSYSGSVVENSNIGAYNLVIVVVVMFSFPAGCVLNISLSSLGFKRHIRVFS